MFFFSSFFSHFWNSFLTFLWSFSSSFVLSAISSSPKSMAATCALFLAAAQDWHCLMFNNDNNLDLTPYLQFDLSSFYLCVNLFIKAHSDLTKNQIAMAKAWKKGNKLREKTHQTQQSSFTFSFNFPWPVALCTESIFLTPFPICYWETAGREGKYWLTECSLCLLTKCALHKHGNEIAVCFLFLCLYFIWNSNNGCLIWLRCDSQYTSLCLSASDRSLTEQPFSPILATVTRHNISVKVWNSPHVEMMCMRAS